VVGVAAVFWFAIMIYLFYIEEKRDKRFIPYFILAVGFSFIVSNMFLKNIVHRPRPIPPDIVSLSSCPRDYSFPSSHAAVAFSATTILMTFDKKRKWYYIGGALLISLSRIYLQCHFFFDVVAGGTIGYFISQSVLLAERINIKHKS
jgi:undecaprenyl-diphosphatase